MTITHLPMGDDAPASPPICLNHLRRGTTYRATTRDGHAVAGTYLGLEVAHGDRSILLADTTTTRSITVDAIERVEAA